MTLILRRGHADPNPVIGRRRVHCSVGSLGRPSSSRVRNQVENLLYQGGAQVLSSQLYRPPPHPPPLPMSSIVYPLTGTLLTQRNMATTRLVNSIVVISLYNF